MIKVSVDLYPSFVFCDGCGSPQRPLRTIYPLGRLNSSIHACPKCWAGLQCQILKDDEHQPTENE